MGGSHGELRAGGIHKVAKGRAVDGSSERVEGGRNGGKLGNSASAVEKDLKGGVS